jgi:Ca-activated chloride channel family protein
VHHYYEFKLKIMKRICTFIIAATLLMAFKTDDTKLVSGYVYDINQQALVGVNVSSKLNQKLKTISNYNGFFQLKVSQSEKKIVVSLLGFQTKEVNIKSGDLKIYLNPDKKSLDEVVVIGYGTQQKVGISNMKSMEIRGFSASPTIIQQDYNTESYNAINENGFKNAIDNSLSTFSIDVDAASYSNMRRFIKMGQLPPKDAVRVEEMINYFGYEYQEPKGNDPVSITTDVADAPWNKNHRLVRIGLKAKSIKTENLPASNS